MWCVVHVCGVWHVWCVACVVCVHSVCGVWHVWCVCTVCVVCVVCVHSECGVCGACAWCVCHSVCVTVCVTVVRVTVHLHVHTFEVFLCSASGVGWHWVVLLKLNIILPPRRSRRHHSNSPLETKRCSDLNTQLCLPGLPRPSHPSASTASDRHLLLLSLIVRKY